MKRKLSIISVLVLMICVSIHVQNAKAESADDDKTVSLGYVGVAYDAFMGGMADTVEEEAKKLGIETYMLTTNSSSTGEQQAKNIEDLIAMGVDMIITTPAQPDTMVDVLEEAVSKGIMCFTINTDCDFEGKISYIGIDNTNACYLGGVEACKALEPGSNVFIITGDSGNPDAAMRAEGWQKAAEEAGMNVVEVRNTDWSTEMATTVTEDWITQYGDDIDAIFTAADPSALGAVEALRQANMLGDVMVTGMAGLIEAKTMLEDKEMYLTVGQPCVDYGILAVETAWKAYNGEEVPEFVEVQPTIITQENVDTVDFLWLG